MWHRFYENESYMILPSKTIIGSYLKQNDRDLVFQTRTKFQGKCWKDDVVTFTAHLSVSIKRLTRYNQKVVLATMLEGKSMPSNMAAYTNHTTLLNNQSALKYLPKCVSSQISGVR